MNDELPPEDQDAAWVTITTPFDAGWLTGFMENPQRLLRINSQMEFLEFEQTGAHTYRMKAKNLSNGREIETVLTVTAEEGGIRITYDTGLKTATRFAIQPQTDGTAHLVVTDEYSGTTKQEREARIDEVDKSLVQWGRDLHRYIYLWQKWSWVPGWRWYMCTVWQSMRPMARRISNLLMVITLIEFIMFLMVFTIFWFEFDKYFD
ncbi:MAG: hypothetical protein HQ504_01795 [Rhodospirillaceae bacterium]|nr:hypothetical protein [Rhodospirillaceae bacterium]